MNRRRQFVAASLGSAALAALGVAWCNARGSKTDPETPESIRQRTLRTLLDAMLPAGFGLPGAIESGVDRYVVQTLTEARYAGVRGIVERGLDELDRVARANMGRPLADIDREACLALLPLSAASPQFESALLDFAIEGYLGHPGRGGNTRRRVWRAIGLPLPAVLPR